MKCNLRLLSALVVAFIQLGAHAQTTTTFTYTGAIQYFTVPFGVTSVTVDVTGGSGGLSSGSNGGCGANVTCAVAVTPGQVLNVYVGSAGGDATFYSGGTGGTTGTPLNVTGGAGASSLSGFGGSGGGGGESDIRTGGTSLANRIVIAGAGGGGGDDVCGFEDGGDGGGAGTAPGGLDCGSYNPFSCGGGASTIAGGSGSGGGGMSGVLAVGGDGTALSSIYITSFGFYSYTYTDGGGGGGGDYGGGGGSAGGGGGGSSYANPLVCSGTIYTTHANCSGDGRIVISTPCIPPVGGAIVGPSIICAASTITYTDPTAPPGGTWSSSNLGVATINPSTGVLTAGIPGTTTITYSITSPCGSAFATTTVTVVSTPAPITGPLSVCAGSSDTVYDVTAGGVWGSSAPGVATIDPVTGIINGIAPVTTIISYSVGSCAVTAILTVNPLPAPITGPTTVCRFTTTTLSDLSPGGTWSSTVPLAATVNPVSGVVGGVGPGGSATNILYTLPTGCSVSHFMSVTTPPLPITGANQICQNNATVLTELVGGGLWSTSSPSIASVTSGVVTGLLPGVVTISYTTPSCPPATHIVTVNPIPSAIYGPTAICVGMTTTLIDTTAGGAWSSGNPLITVDTSGHVTSSTPGTSGTIYYTLPTTCFVQVTVNVAIPPPPIVGPSSVCQGQSVAMTDAQAGGVWSSTDLAIARINDSTGADTGISAGTVNISYTMPSGCFAVMPFLVNPPVTPSIAIIDSPSTIVCGGDSVRFSAIPSNGGVPTYQWTKFSVPIPGATDSVYKYPPIHGDVINCVMIASGVCALNDTATDTFVVNVYPNLVVPTINIMTSAGAINDTIAYVGQTVTFYSSVTWGGSSPTYQWYMNGAPIAGATGISYTTQVYASDTFWCVVTGNPPCASSDTTAQSNKIIVHDYLGISPVTVSGTKFLLFPNPNNGEFTLTGTLPTSANTDVMYEVVDMLGQVVFSGKTVSQNGKVQQQINANNLAVGSYMLRVNTETGTETFHFVKDK